MRACRLISLVLLLQSRETMTAADAAPEADLTGWAAAPFTAAGYTHDVYRKGEGPGVVLIPEMPGAHPGVLALGNHLVDAGFTVAIPSLFGTPGAPPMRPGMVPVSTSGPRLARAV